MGRRKDKVKELHFTETEEGKWKCKHCGEEYAATTSATRLNDHINKREGRGIEVCPGSQSNNFGSHKPDSNDDLQRTIKRFQGQIQVDDAEDQERTQVGPSSISNWKNEDLEMMKRYVFKCLRSGDKVIVVSPRSYLTQEEFIALTKPKTPLDSLVIDIFVEILTDIERKKGNMLTNWYLKTTFSDEALKGKVGRLLNFVPCQNIITSCEKIFIPVRVGARPNEHFYLYIIHLKNREIEIYNSLRNTTKAELEGTAKELLLAMEKLFEDVKFTEFQTKMADDILSHPDGFDCGVFVINYMLQSDNYVKRDSSFQFDSQREREGLALKLLNSDLNQEKQNLYVKARGHYEQVEKQYGSKRSRECFEDVGREGKLQKFFLYCALSTGEVLDDEMAGPLIRRFVYESIDETKKLSEQYDEGYNMLDGLQNYSILNEHQMDKFRGALIFGIAEGTSNLFMANACKNLTEIPSDDQWREDLQKVFLTGNNIQTIPDGTCPRCYHLTTLLLDDNQILKYISDDFFNNMPALKILDLSKTCIMRLPESVSNLKYLTALLISRCWALRYIPPLSNLKQLISLDLYDTAIVEVPMGLESLVNLRYLNLLYTNMSMPASLISKLINLEHLLGLKVTTPEVTATGIQGLYKLEIIVANFQDINVFNTYVSFLDQNCVLRSFELTLMDCDDYSDYLQEHTEYSEYCSNFVKRVTFGGMDLENREVLLPADMKELFVIGCKGVGTVGNCLCSVLSYGRNNNNPHQIERLDIKDCPDVEYLCCLSDNCRFCSSAQLVGSSLFSHLTQLQIWCCHNMETLMTPKLLALLQNLRSIEVGVCYKMKEIVGEYHSRNEVTGSGDLMTGVHIHVSHPIPITLPKLTSLELFSMPQLNFVYRGIMRCPSLQKFSANKCTELKELPQIQISDGPVIPIKEILSSYYLWQK